MQYATIYFFGILLITSCGHSDDTTVNNVHTDISGISTIDTGQTEIIGLEKKQLNDTLKGILSVVGDGIEYMSFYTKFSEDTVSDPEKAWKEVKSLYPDFASRIKYWTEYNGYYVFSVGSGTHEMDRFFWNILYVKKGEREFRYFWPNT